MADDWDTAPSAAAVTAAPASSTVDPWDTAPSAAQIVPQAATVATTQDSSAWRIPKQMGLAAAGAGYNLLGIPGDLEQAVTTPYGPVGRPHHQLLPTGYDFTSTTGLSLDQHPSLTPQGPVEKGLATFAGAIPNALSIAATDGAILPALGISEASGFASEGAKELAPGIPYLPEVVGTLTALAGGGATSWIKSSADAKAAVKQFADASASLKAAKTAASLAKDPTLGAPALASAMIDGSAEKLAATTKLAQASVDKATADSAKTLDSTAAGFGKSTDLQSAGEVAQPAGRFWKTNEMPQKMEVVSKPLLEKMPDDTPSPVQGIMGALNDINSSAGRLQPVVDNLIPSLPKTLQKTFQKVFDGTPDPLTTGEVRQFRSALGDAMSNPKIANDVGQQNLQHLYAAASGDLGQAAKSVGAENEWNNFNTESTRLYGFASGPLAKIISTTGGDAEPLSGILPGQAVKGLLATGQTDGTELAALRAEIPQATDEIAAAVLRQPGTWNGLSAKAKEALVPDPAKRAVIEQTEAQPAIAAARAKQVTDEAAENHADFVSAVQQDQKAGNFRRSRAVADAQEVNQLAKAGLPSVASKLSDFIASSKNALSAAIGGGAAHELGPQILHALGVQPGGATNALMTGLGIAAPAIYRGAKAVVASPSKLVVPVTGAVAGQNALSVSPQR